MKSKRAAKEAAAVEDDKKPHTITTVEEQQPAKKRKRSSDDVEDQVNGADSSVTKKSKKEKKDKKDKKKDKKESRKEKKEKRKDLQDLPEQDDMDVDAGEGTEAAKTAQVAEEASKKSKKDKTNGVVVDEEKEAKKQKKKDKKAAKKEKSESATTNGDSKTPVTNGNAPPAVNGAANEAHDEDAIDLDASAAKKPGRNIVFVGNLPYSATAASISAHFVSLKPVAVRCLTKREDPKACRGIAFVEFASPTQQRTCLDKFHHSMFDDKVSAPRKINVELTAGGGGKNENRQNKIMEKNKKLDENRAKRIEKEKTEKAENSGGASQKEEPRMEIHPSRLARLPNLGR